MSFYSLSYRTQDDRGHEFVRPAKEKSTFSFVDNNVVGLIGTWIRDKTVMDFGTENPFKIEEESIEKGIVQHIRCSIGSGVDFWSDWRPSWVRNREQGGSRTGKNRYQDDVKKSFEKKSRKGPGRVRGGSGSRSPPVA